MKKLILVITMLFCMISVTNADMITINEEIKSDEDGIYGVEFTVNNDYTNIIEFVVGNNDAQDAYSLEDVNLCCGYIVKNIGGNWVASYYRDGDVIRDVSWMNDLTEFDNYQYAFLFTSWYEDTDENGHPIEGWGKYLESGETSGYMGFTEVMHSPFAAYIEGGTIIVGETTHSAVPIPGAIWLLASGCLGLIAIKKKN